MIVALRHLGYDPDAAVTELGPAAIETVLDRGDLADWQPLLRAVAREPNGELAATIERLCHATGRFGLWAMWIARVRERGSLAGLRRKARLSQSELAQRLSMTQSDVSKLERRGDVRLSTLRRYVEAIGATLTVTAHHEGTRIELHL